jgi:isopenicillin N synthase-like dioxygenase
MVTIARDAERDDAERDDAERDDAERDEWDDSTIASTGGSSVPVIDLAPFSRDDPGLGCSDAGNAVARAVGEACETSGFLVVTGHGVAQSTIDEMYAVTQAFFALPQDEKTLVRGPSGDPFEAYCPPDTSLYGGAQMPNLVEMYHSSRYDTTREAVAHGYPAEVAASLPVNVWPERPLEFAAVWQRYFVEMEQLAGRLLHIFAVALGLPQHWFDDKIDRHLSNLAANCYPAQRTAPMPGQVRNRAHVDFSALTILYQDDAPGGLQIYERGRGWRDVPALAGSYVVNLGDLMARWTNDRWVATPHRVVNPPAEYAMTQRISIPFFHLPNHDAIIEAIPTCVSDSRPAKYAPVATGEWTAARRKGRPANYGRLVAS